jgi:3-oxoisoapionate kinase
MSGLLFTFYGDDFTGSTDALEALAGNGVESVLFLHPPDAAAMARYPEARAVGVAGESRSQSPEWMSRHLPEVFAKLRALGAPICQYKVCSTFDSAPDTGSIGRALEIGQSAFGARWVPVVGAAPHLGRYVLFGTLFAAGGGEVHRIDRHPTMAHHPVTPMNEADLRRHLARQTSVPVTLVDLLTLRRGDAALDDATGAVLFDGLDSGTQTEVGRLLWTARPPFAVGSSGLTHALIQQWRALGQIPAEFTPPTPGAVDRMVVVSGSCSPVTEQQIRWSMTNGFTALRYSGPETVEAGLRALAEGRSVVVYSALGPGDRTAGAGGAALGTALGEALSHLLRRSGVGRAIVAGGDTSTFAVRQLGITALTFAGFTVPGAPLCRADTGLELVLKGGQIGPEDFFAVVRRGKL